MLRASKLKKLDLIIKDVIKQYGLEKKLKLTEVLIIWNEIVGDKIAKISEAKKLKDGILTVSVTNPIWRTELTFMKKEIINKINKHFNEEIVKDIIFR